MVFRDRTVSHKGSGMLKRNPKPTESKLLEPRETIRTMKGCLANQTAKEDLISLT